MAAVANAYDIPPQTVGNWVARYRREQAGGDEAKAAQESAEVRRLRAELREARMENEFLKKAAAFFAREQE